MRQRQARPPAARRRSTGAQIKVPLLFVHHADDACGATPYREARAPRAPAIALITVHGGKPPESAACEPLRNARLLRQGSRDRRRDRRLDAEETVRRETIQLMLYAATIFLSSFLLFLVQPLIARLILPWFGGSAAVWTTCMLFFQALLLAGYAYAHFLDAGCREQRAAADRTRVLLVAAVATLPIAPGEAWKPRGRRGAGDAASCCCSARRVGLPYFLLASTSPLLQAWFARARPGENPYRLFAVSNLASLRRAGRLPVPGRAVSRRRASRCGCWSWLFAAFARALRGGGLAARRGGSRRAHRRTSARPAANARRSCSGSRSRPPARCCCSR